MKELPNYISDFLKSKKLNLDDLEFIYKNNEEFDFDCYQETFVFIQKNLKKSHNKLLLVRNNLGPECNNDEITFQSIKLVKVD